MHSSKHLKSEFFLFKYLPIHVILLGGGLTAKNQWRDKGEEFFLPVKVMSKLFRGKYMAELKILYEAKKLQFYGSSEKYHNRYTFKELLNLCYDKDWVPHCKKTFNGAQSVINYLGKYTHRIAISNHRIIRMDEDTVTYYVKDYRKEPLQPYIGLHPYLDSFQAVLCVPTLHFAVSHIFHPSSGYLPAVH